MECDLEVSRHDCLLTLSEPLSFSKKSVMKSLAIFDFL